MICDEHCAQVAYLKSVETSRSSATEHLLGDSSHPVNMSARYTICYVTAVINLGLVLMGVAYVHVFNWMHNGIESGLFKSSRFQSWTNAHLSIFNPKWVMHFWAINYIYQFVWIIYGLTLVCQRTELGALHYRPCLVPISVYILTAISNLCIFAWYVLWDRELYTSISVIPLVAAVIFLYIALFRVTRADHQTAYFLHRMDILWIQRISHVFVHNGLMLHASWTFLVVLFQLCVILQHVLNVEGSVAALFFYPAFLTHLFISFALEACITWYRLRVLFTQYIAYICTPLGGIVLLHFTDPSSSGLISGRFRELHLILLGSCVGLSIMCLLIKISICFGRRHHAPHTMSPSRPPPTFNGADVTEPLSLHKV